MIWNTISIASPPIKNHFSEIEDGLVASPAEGGGLVTTRFVPQLLQKSASGGISCPQLLHRTEVVDGGFSTATSKSAPQLAQKRASGGLSFPQFKHRTIILRREDSLCLRVILSNHN